MEWNEIVGNLITLAKKGHFDLIAHGCNCKKNMGKGIAKELKGAFPMAYEIDKSSPSKLGTISVCDHYQPMCIVVNAYTQYNLGAGGHGKDSDHNRYEAIRSCMRLINERFPEKHIGLPLIGAGLAGLKWSKVKKIIQEELKNMNVTIVHFNG